ncbi:MAG TPA: hypothetical protein VMV16_07665 [Solirubrobacteraceae bacterium]|nr:hypothetical protein [Solirubrobacteraceae bacterium]
MTSSRKLSRTWWPLALAVALSAALAAPAWASVASEQQQGAQILQRITTGTLSRTSLSSTQYERVGEYLMGQALGSNQGFQAMDSRMDDVMGQAAVGQMYVYLGKRYLGVSATLPGRYASMFGLMGAMMSGYHGSLADMMSRYLRGEGSTNYSGMGPGMMGSLTGAEGSASASGGWPTMAIVATVAMGAILLITVLWIGLARLRDRTDRSTPATH